MKRIILLGIILILLAAVSIPLVYAAPGDVVITFTIPASKLNDFRAGFLRARPIRGNYTEKQWIKKIIWDHVFGIYSRGKLDLAKEAAVIDPNIIGVQ